jgi:hypothetical protein
MRCDTMQHVRGVPRAANRWSGMQGWLMIVAVVVIAIAMCLSARPGSSSAGAFTWGEIACSFPNTTLVREAIYSDTVMVKTDAYTFQVMRQRLFLDGACFGAVKHGDSVTVKQSGAVFVNGVQRKAE